MQVRHPMTLAFAFTVALAACSDRGALVAPDTAASKRGAPAAAAPALPQEAFSRWDSPWWRMTDEEIAQRVEEAGGQVFIGFKEPGARGGVDDYGRVHVSPAAVARGKSQARALGATFQFESDDMPMVVARIPSALVSVLRAHPLVDYVEPVTEGEWASQATPWNIHQVQAPWAWSFSNGRGQGQRLLILDSGAPQNHPDLAFHVVQACDGTDGFDAHGHGTAVAGVAAALDNTIGVVGVAPGVQLWSSKIGHTAPSTAALTCGVQFGRSNGIFAMNISASVTPSTALTDQIKAAYWQNGQIIVGAAGNNGGPVRYPANLAEVIAVTATNANNARPSWSNTGPELELSAPGVNVLTTCLPNVYCYATSTSYAAPHVAAAAAILKAHNPTWTNVQVRDRLRNTALGLGPSNEYGAGLLQIFSAIQPPPPPTVAILGQNEVVPWDTCTWWASVSGGTAPYTYQWERDWQLVSTTDSYTASPAGGDFTLRVSVTDAAGQSAHAQMWVAAWNGLGGQPACFF